MQQRLVKKIIITLLLGCVFLPLSALSVPPLTEPLTDAAHVVSPDEARSINAFLKKIDAGSKVQIAVLTISSLEGESLEDFSYQVVETWKLGHTGSDAGVLLLIAVDDRKVRIEVGYGLESRITDAKSARIIRNVIAPAFRQGQYGAGIAQAVQNLAALALDDKELLTESYQEEEDDSPPFFIVLLYFIIIIGAVFFRLRFGFMGHVFRGGSTYYTSSSRSSSRSSSFSSSSFSGFSGGGGSFGGGGASGSW